MRAKPTALLTLALLLAGCAGREHLRPDFGVSNRHNIQVQALDPEAGRRERAVAVSDGQKMEQALKDYRKGRPDASRDHLIISTGK
jgi:type IV pilus biogenesis protein CpaD/CtpE